MLQRYMKPGQSRGGAAQLPNEARRQMGTINLSNSKGRDAVVGSQTVKKPLKVRWLDGQGRQCQSARVMKADLSHDLAALEATAGGRDKIAGWTVAVDLATEDRVVRRVLDL